MATLQDYYNRVKRKLSDDVNYYQIENFVETGTGLGDSISFALNNGLGMKNIYSFEINPEIASRAKNRFIGYQKLNIINTDSYSGLKELLKTLKGNTIFFLDAHFPGADFGYNSYSTTIDNKDLNLPLQNELELICEMKDTTNDIFLIDDLRIYEEANYEMGNWPKEKGGVHTGIDFITNKLGKTHSVEKHYFFSGFLTITPKNK